MSPTLPDSRPVPRWVHIWSIATVVAATSLLALGSLVTSYRVGMADPLWPTEPWYLFFIDWREPSAGFLIEHIHRLAGFVVGAFVSVLAVGLWLTEPRRGLKWVGLWMNRVIVGWAGCLGTCGECWAGYRGLEVNSTETAVEGCLADGGLSELGEEKLG